MRLLSLELIGFKSFADPQKLLFPPGMTAVVGPNGCGKSNISDALAWVLGEQRPSLLRGTEMADVIFAGTSKRKPLGLAEVRLSLELPQTDGDETRLKEVSIARRLHRETGSEYRLNGREVRLKDIQDLLLDTGMGTRAYSFIQQGQIDLILSSKPKDRRLLLEEAAGITRYKLRRAEAEKRLEETRLNLERLEDVLHEVNKQLESLRRQAAKARKAQELDGGIRVSQRILLGGRARDLEAARDKILENLDHTERDLSQWTAQASERASEVEALKLRLEEVNESLHKHSRQYLAADQRLGLLEQERQFTEAIQQDGGERIARLELRRLELGSRENELDAQFQELETRQKKAAAIHETCEAELSASEEGLLLGQGALRHEESELRNLKEARQKALQAEALKAKQRAALQNQAGLLEGKLEALQEDEAIRAPKLEGLLAQEKSLKRELEGLEEQREQAEEAVRIQRSRWQEQEDRRRAQVTELHRLESALEQTERRIQHLNDLVLQGSGSEERKKSLSWLRSRLGTLESLADFVALPEEQRPDLERLLGAWVGTLALEPQQAELLLETPTHLLWSSDAAQEPLPLPEGCQAFDLRWKPGHLRPLEGLLIRAGRCSDASLLALSLEHPHLALVSPRFIRLPFGPVQSGQSAPAASPLKLRADLTQAHKEREAQLDQIEEAASKLKESQTHLMEAQDRLNEMEEDLRRFRIQGEDRRGSLQSVQRQLAEIREATERADQLWDKLEEELKRLRAQIHELDTEGPDAGLAALEERIHQQEERVREAQGRLDFHREIHLERARARDAAWGELEAQRRQILMLQRSHYDLDGEIKRVDLEKQELAQKIQDAAQRIQDIEVETQTLLEGREQLRQFMAERQPQLEDLQENLRVTERRARESREALERERQNHQDLLLSGAQIQGRLDALAREIQVALGMEVPVFLSGLSEEEVAAWEEGELLHQTRLAELQNRRMELGSVNPLAILELEETESRLEFMQTQKADVLGAIQNLESTIQEINEESETRFRETFDFVNARFQEVFREVFGGGQASLSLLDPKDLLECGIEITAQPPGKTAKSLSLLSGGEKALTAISLLFAIFHYKPSPFCVLDEVDAPLDEANVARFAQLVQRMKEQTQFLVITHQKPTMVAADTLYGVTQPEPGCSTLVSVQLKGAEELVR